MTAVENFEVGVYTIPTDAPEGDGTFAWSSTTMIVVRATAAGETGIGWTYGAPECGAIVKSMLEPIVVGADVMDVSLAQERMVRAVRNSGREGAVGYAISAVDAALWDLKARILGLPLYKLLGAQADQVAVYASGGFTPWSRDRLDSWLDESLEVGSTAVKIKIGESWGTRERRDIERMTQVRQRIGDRASLFVDANGAYSAKQAIRIAHSTADLDVTWFEEPVSSDNPAGLAQVRSAIRADVAAGEYGYTLFAFRTLCETGAVDVVQADATRCGGITEWMRAAAVVASFGLQLSGHCAPNLHAHVAAAIPNLRNLEWFHDHHRIEQLVFDGALQPRNGVVTLDSTRPGNGLEFKAADAERYRV